MKSNVYVRYVLMEVIMVLSSTMKHRAVKHYAVWWKFTEVSKELNLHSPTHLHGMVLN
jgi:hypothetical protein